MTPASNQQVGPEEGGSPTTARVPLVSYDSEDDGAEDPMVSNPIQPFVIPVTIRRPHTGNGAHYRALIDSGCTWCLINKKVVSELGIRI